MKKGAKMSEDTYNNMCSMLEYLKMPDDKSLLVTKGAIEDYAVMRICRYLESMIDGICDQLRYDDSEWDKAISFAIDYINDSIKELEEEEE